MRTKGQKSTKIMTGCYEYRNFAIAKCDGGEWAYGINSPRYAWKIVDLYGHCSTLREAVKQIDKVMDKFERV